MTRFLGYGWSVTHIADANDLDALGALTHPGGSGLGLSIVNGAVKFHNGSVFARTSKTTVFEVIIDYL